jgi:glutathionylspermidine synthase
MNAPRLGSPLPAERYHEICRRMAFDYCKFDLQVGDLAALADAPILLPSSTWQKLCAWAEALFHETLALEAALLRAPHLHDELGLPRAVRRTLAGWATTEMSAVLARVMRFDFHWTTAGWRISEVNCDVPGGFIESAAFATLVSKEYPGTVVPPDPAAALVAATAARLGAGAHVGLLHASAYTDDRQVMMYLGQRLFESGLHPLLLTPADLVWNEGRAAVATKPVGALDGLIRFYPAEWLPNLPRSCAWKLLFAGARTPQCNPATALLVQSKRVPLIWDRLNVDVSTWRRLLPETHHPRPLSKYLGSEWVLKPALGRVGDGIGMPGVTSTRDWRSIRRLARWFPRHWVAQARFAPLPLHTGSRSVYSCIGVFVIDGRAAGAYGRIAARPLIDGQAQDAAVLV